MSDKSSLTIGEGFVLQTSSGNYLQAMESKYGMLLYLLVELEEATVFHGDRTVIHAEVHWKSPLMRVPVCTKDTETFR